MTLTLLPWYTGIILAMAEFFGMHHVWLHSFPALLQRLTHLPDRVPRSIEQYHVHGQCRPKSVLCRDYQCFDGLGGLLLGNAISQSYVYQSYQS